jgi:hypothetical protein
MGKENGEKIIAYRIGKGLFCPDCFEKGARDLRKAQDPDEPEVTMPSKPIEKGDLRIYICEQCETIIGDPKVSAEKKQELEALREQRFLQMKSAISDQFKKEDLEEKPSRLGRHILPKRLRKERDLTDLQDMVEDCANKISFVATFLSQTPLEEGPDVSEDDKSGFCLVLRDIEDELDLVVDELCKKRQEGLIIEKEMS